MFKDFRQLIESPGFVGLVKSMGQFALVVSMVERVSRKTNIGITKVMTSKQRETAEDQVVNDLHIGMVSFDFCPGQMMSVPFVSYEVRGDRFDARTPMAGKFLRMMLDYTHVFADEKQFFDHIK